LNPPVLFALGFANLPMLYGLGAASLPIIIHLLNRRKFRETRWAAMQFLLAAIRKNYRRIRLEQWLLLAVRTLVVILVVLAMAQPFLESLGAIPVLAGQRTHRVIVLDGSLSMAYTPADVSRFEQAKTVAARLVKDARRGDAISVLVMGDPPRVVIGDPSPNHSAVLKEIEEITLPHGATDLTASFETLDRVLAASTIPQKEVVFLTDLQAASWRRAGTGGEEGLKRALAKLETRHPRSAVIDLGKAGGENRAITDIRLGAPIVTLGSSFAVLVDVRNFGPSPAPNTQVRLIIDGQLGPEQVIDLPVRETVTATFTYAFTAPGDHIIEAKIDDDPLLLDNHRWLVVPVRESLSVLLVDGQPKTRAFESETDYLAEALNASTTSEGLPPPIKTEVVTESRLGERDLAPFDVVALCNIAQFTEAEVAALDAYLRQGGGVVVFGGDQVMPDNYNRLLYADGTGLLPAAIGPTVGSVERKNEAAFGFDARDLRHPIVNEYNGADPNVLAGLTNVRAWQYHKLKLPKNSPAQVVLAFANGDPALIESPRHRGRVIQVATSADAGWTNWPLHRSYPPIMEQIIMQASTGRLSERNVRVGQPLDQALPPNGAGASASVIRPDSRTMPTRLQAAGDVSQLHFEETDLSGTYLARVGPPLALDITFAADPDPVESDPEKLDRDGLADAFPGWTFAYFTDWQNLSENATSVSRRGELHRYCLYGVLGLLMLESFLAWKFGHQGPRG
jgi:hypothetical protein